MRHKDLGFASRSQKTLTSLYNGWYFVLRVAPGLSLCGTT